MRIRTIKPEFWTNEPMSSLQPLARLLAIGLLNLSDDEGYFPASTAIIRGSIFPFMDDSSIIPVLLLELYNIGYIDVGTCKDGKLIGRVVKFSEHQVISHFKESKIKVVVTFSNEFPVAVQYHSGSSPSLNGMEVELEMELKGKENTAKPGVVICDQ